MVERKRDTDQKNKLNEETYQPNQLQEDLSLFESMATDGCTIEVGDGGLSSLPSITSYGTQRNSAHRQRKHQGRREEERVDEMMMRRERDTSLVNKIDRLRDR
jgi:hypothetical protein